MGMQSLRLAYAETIELSQGLEYVEITKEGEGKRNIFNY